MTLGKVDDVIAIIILIDDLKVVAASFPKVSTACAAIDTTKFVSKPQRSFSADAVESFKPPFGDSLDNDSRFGVVEIVGKFNLHDILHWWVGLIALLLIPYYQIRQRVQQKKCS